MKLERRLKVIGKDQPKTLNKYMSTDTSSSSGMGFVGLLTIVFIVLKLLDKINWSWWWVLSPIWISISAILAIFIVIILVILVKSIFND